MSLLLVRQVSIHVEHLVIAVRHKRMDLLAVKRHVFCVDVCLDRDNTSDQQSTNAAPEVLAITSEGASSSCCSVQGTNCQALKAASARTQAHRGFSISGRHAVTCFHFGTIAVRSATTYANVDAACLSHSSRWLDVMGCRVCDVELLVPRRNSSLIEPAWPSVLPQWGYYY